MLSGCPKSKFDLIEFVSNHTYARSVLAGFKVVFKEAGRQDYLIHRKQEGNHGEFKQVLRYFCRTFEGLLGARTAVFPSSFSFVGCPLLGHKSSQVQASRRIT